MVVVTYDYRQASSIEDVQRLCAKYLRMLDVKGLSPTIKLRSNLGSKWLGRASFKPVSRICEVEFQKSILADLDTLERVVAHEMCHVAEYANWTELDTARLKAGIGATGHGPEFLKYAAIVNQHMGAGFVTIKSDQSYKQESTTKPFTMLIEPMDYYADSPQRLGWAVGVRMSPKMLARIERSKETYKGRTIVVTDAQWANGPKIGDGFAAPKGDQEAALWKLYEAAEK